MSTTVEASATATARVTQAFERVEAADRPEVWITLRPSADVLADAFEVDSRVSARAELPLAGMTVAVKDNIDVGGVPTTAGCPAFAYIPAADAPAVARLREAGAVVLGKTNMDQFATGLVGTRSPYGAVRDARDPARVAGGSSSGSAVAVALGIADLGLGTDTAGSGRVPAAFQGIVGLKPTRGLVSVRGVVPACRSFDCVSVFARTITEAELALALIAGSDPEDPLSRSWPADAPLSAPPRARVGIAPRSQLARLSAEALGAFDQACTRLREAGSELVEIDITALLQAGALLYEGAFVAERYAAVGEFIAAQPEAVDPSVARIILGAEPISAADYLRDRERLDELRLAAAEALCGLDALMLPTAPFQPTIAQVAAEPLAINAQLGTYTSFCNLLDMCAVAVPAGEADGGCFGVTVLAPAWHDRVAADVARRLGGAAAGAGQGVRGAAGGSRDRGGGSVGGLPSATRLLVVGAHLSGQPLNGELTTRGARLVGQVLTASGYRLYRLDTTPPKPGLVRSDAGGAAIEGELWELPPAGLAGLLAELPSPMALGRVALADGSEVVGFLCEPAALERAEEITAYGGWLAYLRSSAG
jgi:allophanate hydrolase